VGFPTELETIFQTVVAAVNLAMVFVIQHTQSRQQVATQRKLDEILRALTSTEHGLGGDPVDDVQSRLPRGCDAPGAFPEDSIR
jgi:hypothetical protein